DGMGVCEIGAFTPQNIANAHLIAAAPEMLQAIEMCNNYFIKDFREWVPEENNKVIGRLEKYLNLVIKKARGG
ncbi:hypothetical protein EBZ39_13760, partial [bacterium]|nr:hypothetical protein [bacterium]